MMFYIYIYYIYIYTKGRRGGHAREDRKFCIHSNVAHTHTHVYCLFKHVIHLFFR